MRTLQSNIWKLYVIRALRSFMLVMPVLTLFFRENGLTVHDIFVLQAIFALCLVLLEIPTGYFADIFSRKTSIIIGGIISTIGFAVYSASYGFWGFLVAEILLGIGMCFVSSADTAMLHDTLVIAGQERRFKKLESRNLSLSVFSEALAGFIGGFLALISLRLPLILDVFSIFLIVPLAFMLVEPARKKTEAGANSIKSMLVIVHYALVGHKEVAFLILYFGLVSASTLTMVWFSQSYLLEAGLFLNMFGSVWAFLLCVTGALAWNADAIEKFLGRKKSLILLWAFPVAGYMLTGSILEAWGFLFLVPFYVTRGILDPVIKDYTNRLITSDIRATVLSVKSVPARLIFMIIGPGVSWISDSISLQIALLTTGIFFLINGGMILILMARHRML